MLLNNLFNTSKSCLQVDFIIFFPTCQKKCCVDELVSFNFHSVRNYLYVVSDTRLLLCAVYVLHLIRVSLLFCVVISNTLTLFHIFNGTGKRFLSLFTIVNTYLLIG